MSRINHGRDGSQQDIQETYAKLIQSHSFWLKIYFYYLQIQQWLFSGRWSSFKSYNSNGKATPSVWPEEQRLRYYRAKQSLIHLWKWNGPDIIFFLI